MALNNQESRKNSLQEEFSELQAVKSMIESQLFQKYFATPLYKEEKELKNAYECESLKELFHIKGKHWGIRRFFKCVDEVDTRYKFVKHDLDKF